jgi:hypothetical protein
MCPDRKKGLNEGTDESQSCANAVGFFILWKVPIHKKIVLDYARINPYFCKRYCKELETAAIVAVKVLCNRKGCYC